MQINKDDLIVSTVDDLMKYAANTKHQAIEKGVRMVIDAIKDQEKHKNEVLAARTSLQAKLCISKLQEHKSVDGLYHLKSLLPPGFMHHHKANLSKL